MGQHQLQSDESSERVILIGIHHPRAPKYEVNETLDELARLARTAGATVCEQIIYTQNKINPGHYIGKGKAHELKTCVIMHEADSVIFDEDLSPAQTRNLEKILDVKVLDRTQIILDIFALHAHTKPGRLQIELARLEYLLPRLRRMWTHLERQKGGIGLRGGPGEQQIEVDRRIIKTRIWKLKRELENIRRHRSELRRGRRRHGWALVSLVGYTNAGKSTLLNRLTGSEVTAADELFVTLDPTTREIQLPNHQSALITDTVGFIKKLPHHLVEAFQATLEEVSEADLLIHVIDASHPQMEPQIEAVNKVLRDLGAHEKPVVTVFNKTDLLEPSDKRWSYLAREIPHAVALSAITGAGIEAFLNELADCLRGRYTMLQLRIPPEKSKLISKIQAHGHILEAKYAEDGYFCAKVNLSPQLAALCNNYISNS